MQLLVMCFFVDSLLSKNNSNRYEFLKKYMRWLDYYYFSHVITTLLQHLYGSVSWTIILIKILTPGRFYLFQGLLYHCFIHDTLSKKKTFNYSRINQIAARHVLRPKIKAWSGSWLRTEFWKHIQRVGVKKVKIFFNSNTFQKKKSALSKGINEIL